MAEKNRSEDANTIFDLNSDKTSPLDTLTDNQISELYYILSGKKPSSQRLVNVSRIRLLRGKNLPETDFITVSEKNKKKSLFTEGNDNLPTYVIKLLLQLLYGKDKIELNATREKLRNELMEYNAKKGEGYAQNFVFVDEDLEDIMSNLNIEEHTSPKKESQISPKKIETRIDVGEVIRRSTTWATIIQDTLPVRQTMDKLRVMKEYISERVSGSAAVYINDRFKKFGSKGITTMLDLFKDLYQTEGVVETSPQTTWDNARLLNHTVVNLSKNHNNGMGLLGEIARQKLFLLEEEFKLGSELITLTLDGERFHPVGRADFICMNDLGQLVIIDLKTPATLPNYPQHVFSTHRAIQLEMYALLFDMICSLLNIPLGIAYTGILYWNPESNKTFMSKGSVTFCKIPRNPGVHLNTMTERKTNLLKSINV